jgi:hypothetical protein
MTGNVVEQYMGTGSVDYTQAAFAGATGGLFSYGLNKVVGAVSGNSAFSNGTFSNAIKQGVNGFKNFMLQEDGYIDISGTVGKGGTAGVSEAAEWSSERGIYEVGYRAQLEKGIDYPGVSDARHFQEANRQLHEAFQADPTFAQRMEEVYPGIVDGVKPGSRGAFPRKAPTPDVTWHHNPYEEGALDLVPYDQHTSEGPIQDILHPDNKGGMEKWGGGRKRTK